MGRTASFIANKRYRFASWVSTMVVERGISVVDMGEEERWVIER